MYVCNVHVVSLHSFLWLEGGWGKGGKFQSEFLALTLYIRPQVDFSLDALRLRRNRWGEVQKGWCKVFTC
jgi:hypothetical protein